MKTNSRVANPEACDFRQEISLDKSHCTVRVYIGKASWNNVADIAMLFRRYWQPNRYFTVITSQAAIMNTIMLFILFSHMTMHK